MVLDKHSDLWYTGPKLGEGGEVAIVHRNKYIDILEILTNT